jgi:hypothetical protein
MVLDGSVVVAAGTSTSTNASCPSVLALTPHNVAASSSSNAARRQELSESGYGSIAGSAAPVAELSSPSEGVLQRGRGNVISCVTVTDSDEERAANNVANIKQEPLIQYGAPTSSDVGSSSTNQVPRLALRNFVLAFCSCCVNV